MEVSEPGGLDSRVAKSRTLTEQSSIHRAHLAPIPSFCLDILSGICVHFCLQHWVPSDRQHFVFQYILQFGVVLFIRVNPIWTYFITEGCTLNRYNSIKIQIPLNDVGLPDLAPIYLPYHISFIFRFVETWEVHW